MTQGKESAMPGVTELNVNGTRYSIDVDSEATLLSVLRDQLDLTGTKYGCGVGQRQITTIEGLEKNGQLHPVQQAFIDVDAMQCAYCTSGMILGSVALLKSNPHPSEAEIVEYMNGHLCRCGVYQRIQEAISLAAKRMKGSAA